MFLFPFDKIKKGNRIVIYGAGVVGIHFRSQLAAIDYAKVVLWVDRNKSYHCLSGEITPPSSLLSLNESEFDYVVIAVQSQKTREEISRWLTNVGIATDKIVCGMPKTAEMLMTVPLLTMDSFLKDSDVVTREIQRYLRCCDRDMSFWVRFIKEVKSAAVDKIQYRKLVERTEWLVGAVLTTPQERLILLRILTDAEVLSNLLVEAYIENIACLKGMPHQQYWLLLNVATLMIYNPEFASQTRFNRIRHLRNEVVEQLRITVNHQKTWKQDNKTIVFTFPYLRVGAIVDLYSGLINTLEKRGYEIHLIDMGLFVNDSSACFIEPKARLTNTSRSDINHDKMECRFHENIRFHYLDEVPFLDTRLQAAVDLIHELNPVCICMIEGFYSILSDVYCCHYPTVYLPLELQNYHCCFYHKRLFIQRSEQLARTWDGASAECIYVPAFHSLPPVTKKVTRREYGFSESDFVMITVGDRLNTELAGMYDAVCEFILQHPQVKWLIVGIEAINSQKYVDNDMNRQIQFVPYEPDLPALYNICDIYINPGRYGGGTSIAWAMLLGVAALSLRYAGCENAGETLISKQYIYDTVEEFIVGLEALLYPEELTMAKQIAKQTSHEWSAELVADKLERAVLDLSEVFSIQYSNGGQLDVY